MRWLFLFLLLALAAPVTAAWAEESASPFTAPAPSGSAAAAQSVDDGVMTRIGRTFVMLQRDINRGINQRLVAIKRGDDAGALWAGIVAAFLYGVFHALGPGHGKSVVIGYFLGRNARPWRGVVMAAWIAVSHVVGAVIIVGIAHLILSKSLVSPTNEFFWLRIASYAAIVLVGVLMLREWARGGHAHRDHTDHAHGLGDAHGHACNAGDVGWLKRHAPLEQRILALAAGLVPCSGAILILLFTMANGLILAGVLLSGAIALGMGITLAGLGVASILLRHQVVLRLPDGGRTGHWLALSAPTFVIAIGTTLLLLTVLAPLQR
ncbi:nickel/cobalt transporter [Dongia sp.]|uniref:nickel/cobalt transporter n=1 Tax=Dongia sp. TaxID=1977262 RepID=UPI0035B18A48